MESLVSRFVILVPFQQISVDEDVGYLIAAVLSDSFDGSPAGQRLERPG